MDNKVSAKAVGLFYEWLQPGIAAVYFFVSVAIYGLALRSYREKWLWLGPMLFFQYLAFVGCNAWAEVSTFESLWGMLICIWTSHSLSMLFLEDHTFSVDGCGIFQEQTVFRKWRTWNNTRLLFTSRSENRTSSTLRKNQTHLSFTVRCVAKLGICWILHNNIAEYVAPGPFMPMYPAEFDKTRETFFRRLLFNHQHPVTLREIKIRAVFAFFWALPTCYRLEAAHALLALFFVVVLRVDQPHEWPPIYGSLTDSYSLRGFWGKFWHRIVVIPYANVGKLLAKHLGFGPRSLSHKLITAGTIFVLSGAVHAVVAWQLGDKCWYLDIWWFLLNFLATAAETIVSRRLSQKADQSGAPPAGIFVLLNNKIVRRCIGYTWVYLFFFWSVPKWQFPKIHSAIIEVMNIISGADSL